MVPKMRHLALALAIACGGNGVRAVDPTTPPLTAPPPLPAPPPRPPALSSICTGAVEVKDLDVPRSLCPNGTMRTCECASGPWFVFCTGDSYYYQYEHDLWLTVCPP
jgi:hypothetical protein